MLEIKNISKTYNRQGKDFFAVKDVNLNILDGDFCPYNRKKWKWEINFIKHSCWTSISK